MTEGESGDRANTFSGLIHLPWVCCVALPSLFVCLFDRACFFLPSFSSLIKACDSHMRHHFMGLYLF